MNSYKSDVGHGDYTDNLKQPLLLQPSYARSTSLLSDELRSFRISLRWWALDHSTWIGKFVSYLTFAILAVFVPIVSSLPVWFQVPSFAFPMEATAFHLLVQFPESALAFLGFSTLTCFFRKYGLRQLLFLDVLQEDTTFVRRGYTRKLDKAFRYLAFILLPSSFVEIVHKIIFFSTVKISLPYVSAGFPLNSIAFVLVLGSWVYRTGLFLLVSVLFRLTCELQILRFEGLHKMFEGCGSDGGEIFQEHVRIRKQLSIISHRYRFFIIASLVVITASQFAALFMVLASKSDKNFFNSGDLLVCSTVQLSGFFLCLLGAARITHRAQGMAAVASRWNMSMTCAMTGVEQGKQIGDDFPPKSNCNENDSDDSSDMFISFPEQHPSNLQTRQALVSYLAYNNKGITLFGYALDRGLLHTLFAFEFSLVMWILSKVVVLSD
ncbi:putative ATP-dependent rRNA helicase SPB4 [Hibiscus syriacus]|uniref:ATP-dependent rRNA helicase SPB4 n=1 Tax=Hibiscus syriacus TaxID=106335 RepID=A0A6A3B5G4_HIBSY|nr:uncharacterized protein LOC120117703 [Hibiscus syriacus]KAE8710512.1 putative ATP-dependent rRNA helicase SPB4 [Hibiscus syriacus]